MASLPPEPFSLFAQWFEEARYSSMREPNAMTVATATKSGIPSARVVLLKHADENGFVFYTNLGSRKGQELQDNPRAALCFHWMPLGKQVRVDGAVEQVSTDEADAYFQSRPRKSRIGAWASKQSQELKTRMELEQRVLETTAKFGFGNIPRPPYWSGFRVIPEKIEFWQEAPFRLHNRILYTRENGGWKISRLFP
ncbi:MAG: pyridoxamine 5'-phosphate oxidase [Alphaproteobacteria bacterium]|nr:pyridoxamine 5'-phosphate oxidase [Alphaproteobacteria bacterium]